MAETSGGDLPKPIKLDPATLDRARRVVGERRTVPPERVRRIFDQDRGSAQAQEEIDMRKPIKLNKETLARAQQVVSARNSPPTNAQIAEAAKRNQEQLVKDVAERDGISLEDAKRNLKLSSTID